MSYIKRGIAVLLAAGLVAPAAFSHAAREHTSSHRMHSTYSGTTRTKRMNEMIDRNSGRTHLVLRGWRNNISFGGFMNFDATYAQRGWNVNGIRTAGIIPAFNTPSYDTESSTALGVTNANLLFDIRLMRNIMVHIGYVYFNPLGPVRAVNGLDEAHITFKNILATPLYMRLGRGWAPYGSYDTPYPLTYSLVQLLTQTNADMIQLGYVSVANGMYGVIFAFNDNGYSSFTRVDSGSSIFSFGSTSDAGAVHHPRTTRIKNYGAKIGYMGMYRMIRFDLEASYLKDVRSTLFFHNNLFRTIDPLDDADEHEQFRRAGGIALHAYFTRGPYDLLVDYTGALRSIETDSDVNARWTAYVIRGGYRFMSYRRPSKVELGYERANHTMISSGEHSSIFKNDYTLTPKYRYYVNFIRSIGRHTKLTLQYVFNKRFNCESQEQGDSGSRSSNVFNARVGVEF